MGLTAARFADEIGVQRSGISHILSGRNQPSYDFLLKILARYPEISTDWLMLGKGEMIRSRETPIKPVQADLFGGNVPASADNSHAQPEKPNPEVLEPNPEVTNVTTPERIVFFYPDGTYTSYFPR